MRQFGSMLYFECKKIWKRRSTWITLGLMAAICAAMDCAYLFGSTYVEGEFHETHMEGIRIDRENGRKLSGRNIDDALLKEMQDAYTGIADEKDYAYMLTEEYQTEIRPYSPLYTLIRYMSYSIDKNPLTVTEQQLYEGRQQAVTELWDGYRLTDSEKAYWQKKEEKLKKPFTYQYAEGFENLISMSGIYRVCLLVTFLIAICMSSVFTEEHSCRTDQLILCCRLGRKQIYFAKIAAGSIFSLCAAGILFLAAAASSFTIYGTDGCSAAVQLILSEISDTLTVGQIFLIMTGILLVSSVLSGIFTMVLSEIVNSGIASMAVVIAVLFLARLIPIPYDYRVLSQAWNYMPINLLKFDAGFSDPRLVSIFGLQLTSWQFAPVLYTVLGIVLVMIGKKAYCGYQVEGR